MKRILMLVLTLVFALSCAAMSVSAAPYEGDMVEAVGEVFAPKVTTPPTLDGVIGADEWNANAAFELSGWNMKSVASFGFIEVSPGWNALIHFAWDNDYFYIAAEITDPTLTARININDEADPSKNRNTEGDYMRMRFDFGPTVISGAQDSTPSLAFCLNEDYENGNSWTTKSLMIIDQNANSDLEMSFNGNYTADTSMYGISVDKEKNLWTWEGRYPWEHLNIIMQSRCNTTFTPAEGAMATALIEYADIDSNYQLINWFGTSVTGYEIMAAWIPDEYGVTINFVGADTEIEARPETTLPETETAPETTVPDTETDGGDDTTPPAATDSKTEDTTTTAPTTDPTTEAPKADEGGLPIGAIIGIVAAAVVVIAVVVVIVLKKKK